MAAIAESDALPPIGDVLKTHNLWARQSLGQNFIFDLNITRRIARQATPLDTHPIIEIGPGPGGLTRGLLMEGAQKVIAIEADKRFLPILENIRAAYPNRLDIICADALATPPETLTNEPYKIVSNLPYNIGTTLLLSWLHQSPLQWESLTLMFQKEVARRICASAGDKDYGRLSVLAHWLAETRILFDIPPDVFVPPPKVTSTVIQIRPRPAPLAEAQLEMLEKVTAAAFGQRRKMLRASLKQIFPQPQDILHHAGIDETARAETLSIQDFCALARLLEA